MKLSLSKATLYLAYLYTASLYVLAYDTFLNQISKLLFLLLCGFFLLDTLNRKSIVKNIPVYVYMILFALMAFASCFWSLDFSYTLGRTVTFAQMLILFFIFFNLLKEEQDVYSLINAIFWGGMVMCLYAVVDYGPAYIIRSITTGVRLGSEINQANAFGFYCAIMVTIAGFKGLYQQKYIYMLLAVLPFFLGAGSGSKRTIIVLVISLAFLFALKSGKIKLGKIILYLIIAVSIFLILYNMESLQPFFRRFNEMLESFSGESSSTDDSTSVRINMIKFGFERFKERPILGYGTESYYLLYQEYFGKRMASHCNYIQILVSYGIVGFALFYGSYVYVLVKTLKYGFKVNKELSSFVIIMLVITFINDVTTTTLTNKFAYIYLAIMVAFCNIASAKCKNRKQKVANEAGGEI